MTTWKLLLGAVPWVLLAAGCEQTATVGRATPDTKPSRDASSDGGEADAARDGGTPTDSGAGDAGDGAAGCPAPEVALCNPVANTGCSANLAQRCAPDLTASTLAGYCTFMGAIPDGGLECFNSVVTESCPPSFTCFDNECRELCFCDADCSEGQCCSERLGEQGFRMCGAC